MESTKLKIKSWIECLKWSQDICCLGFTAPNWLFQVERERERGQDTTAPTSPVRWGLGFKLAHAHVKQEHLQVHYLASPSLHVFKDFIRKKRVGRWIAKIVMVYSVFSNFCVSQILHIHYLPFYNQKKLELLFKRKNARGPERELTGRMHVLSCVQPRFIWWPPWHWGGRSSSIVWYQTLNLNAKVALEWWNKAYIETQTPPK